MQAIFERTTAAAEKERSACGFSRRRRRVAKLRFTTRKQIRALVPHAKKLRFSTLANLSEKNPQALEYVQNDVFLLISNLPT